MRTRSPFLPLLTGALAVLLLPSLPGCTLFGLGAAAGATVGGCALLDRNEDDRVTEDEFSAGLFDAWDDDDDGVMTRAEFDTGVGTSGAYAGWSGSFEEWDDDGDGTLTEAEFTGGTTEGGDVTAMLDDGCDDLGL